MTFNSRTIGWSVAAVAVAAGLAMAAVWTVRRTESAVVPSQEELADQDRGRLRSPATVDANADLASSGEPPATDATSGPAAASYSQDYAVCRVSVAVAGDAASGEAAAEDEGFDLASGGPLPADAEVSVSMSVRYTSEAPRKPPGGGAMYRVLMLRTSQTGAAGGEAYEVCEKSLWVDDAAERAAAPRRRGPTDRQPPAAGFTATAAGRMPPREGQWLFQIWRFTMPPDGSPYTVVYEAPVEVRAAN